MLTTKDTTRLVELANRPALHEQKGVGGVSYRVVEDGGRFLVLILRDGVAPQVSRTRKTLQEAKIEVTTLLVMGRAMHSRVGKR